ncbi:MAG: hypothetical protein AAF845_07535 [Bacteroidota bacterium]
MADAPDIDLPDDAPIEVKTADDLGLTSRPRRGDPCSDEGRYTCGSLNQVLKCENGRWRSTPRSC